MEINVKTTPRAGDRRQRAFNGHGTPKPIFFDKPSHPSSLSVKRHKRARPSLSPFDGASGRMPCSPRRPFTDIRFASEKAKSVSFNVNSPLQFQQFDQRFRKLRILGEGDFGKVFEVERKQDGRRFAIKKSTQAFTSKSDKDRKFEEVRSFEQLPPHPNILRFYGAWEEKGHLFIQTELCESSLQQYMEVQPVDPQLMGWPLFMDILTGLDHIHEQGFIHLDIKPDNILIGYDERYKIGDLGLMKGRNPADNSSKDCREGDNRYLAPELLEIRPIITTRADVFSLGMTILAAICDIELPKNGELWQQMRDDNCLVTLAREDLDKLPSDMAQLIGEMVRKDFDRRPTCRDLLNNKIITSHLGASEPKRRSTRKRPCSPTANSTTTSEATPIKKSRFYHLTSLKLQELTLFLTSRTRSLFRNNNPTTEHEQHHFHAEEHAIFRERSPAITPSSANRRSSGGTASPSGRSPQMSPLSTRLLRNKPESDFAPIQSSKVSKNLLSMFDDDSEDEDLDF